MRTSIPGHHVQKSASDSSPPERGPTREGGADAGDKATFASSEPARCMLCGVADEDPAQTAQLMRCHSCDSLFHAQCANLPLPPEEGDVFCRHACYASFHKQQQQQQQSREGAGKAPPFMSGDFPRLATQIQNVLQEHAGRLQFRRQLPLRVDRGGTGNGSGRGSGRGRGRAIERGEEQSMDRKRALQGVPNILSRRHPRLSTDAEIAESSTVVKDPNGYTVLQSASGVVYSPGRRDEGPVARSRSSSSSSVKLPSDEARNPPPLPSPPHSSAPRRSLQGFETQQDHRFRGEPTAELPSPSSLSTSRQTRSDYAAVSAPGQVSGPPLDASRSRHGFLPATTSPSFPMEGAPQQSQTQARVTEDSVPLRTPAGFVPLTSLFDGHTTGRLLPVRAGVAPRISPDMHAAQPPPQMQQDGRLPLRREFEVPHHGSSAAPSPSPYVASQRGVGATTTASSGLLPAFTVASANNYEPQAIADEERIQPSTHGSSQPPPPRHTPNVPWRNPTAFPADIYERFNCHADDANHVFRIDLTPVFADKATRLYQPEIDFFFRCFESPDVSLVVKGMSSELNQYIWAWPFILECCGSDTHFAFDHFQFRRNIDTDMPELAYVGELRLSMASFNSYLEKYLSSVPGKDVVVLEDHVTKKPVTIVASENIIALNDLVLAKHCAQDGEFVHVNKGRQHFWRVVEKDAASGSINAPCVFLSWEWVYQGVSQRGISTECWLLRSVLPCVLVLLVPVEPSLIIVAAGVVCLQCGVAIVRTGQFLRSALTSGRPRTSQLLAFAPSPTPVDRGVVAQRQAQMVLFLESILPCLDAIVEEAYELGLSSTDDSDEFRKIFDDESMWRTVDADLREPPADNAENYSCGICGREITNLYKQCLGCAVYSRRCRPNMAYPVFRICLRCHSQPEQHHFKPRAIFSYYDKVLSSEGHTGLLPATRRYQSVRSYFKCRCVPSVRCPHCGGCESCSCLCHTLFQTRFRFTAPAPASSRAPLCRLRVACFQPQSRASGIKRIYRPTCFISKPAMRRNYGSLDLAALDLHTPFSTDGSLEDRFSAMDPSGDADADYLYGSECSSDESMCVGFPLERLARPPVESHAMTHSAPMAIRHDQPQAMDMVDDMPELMLPPRSLSARGLDEDVDMRSNNSLLSSSDVPQHLHEQHHVELNALRCLSLKMMLSNLSTSATNPAAAGSSKTSYNYSAVNERTKTSLLPIRRPSLQSV
ncbi:hypothetical protein BBJ28_00007453 [Nothophytophthora sp. Chile5]|nr:hypothetical protein BBJ28_00007453 [Nothophytophthora sp. Chile5]